MRIGKSATRAIRRYLSGDGRMRRGAAIGRAVKPVCEFLEGRVLLADPAYEGSTMGRAETVDMAARGYVAWAHAGLIDNSTDVDMWKITNLPAGYWLRAITDGDHPTNPVDSLIRIFDAWGNQLGINNGGGWDSQVDVHLPSGGTVYVAVSSQENRYYDPSSGANLANGGTGYYTLWVDLLPSVVIEGSSGTQSDGEDNFFKWKAWDPDGMGGAVSIRKDGAAIAWNSSYTGTYIEASFGFNELGPGYYDITWTAWDVYGASCTITQAVTVYDDDTTQPTVAVGVQESTGVYWDVSDASGLSWVYLRIWKEGIADPVYQNSVGVSGYQPTGSIWGDGNYAATIYAGDNDGDWNGDSSTNMNDAPGIAFSGSADSESSDKYNHVVYTASDPGGWGSVYLTLSKYGEGVKFERYGYASEDISLEPYGRGTYSLTVLATDQRGSWKRRTRVVTVTNSAPVAKQDDYRVLEDQTLGVAAPGVLANDTDADGDPLAMVGTWAQSNYGSSIAYSSNGSFVYTPPKDFNGDDWFWYGAADGTTSNYAPVFLHVTAVNDRPSFTAANPPAVNEDAPAQEISGWAAFDPGPDNEAGQKVKAYAVWVEKPALFAELPRVDASGTLRYRPASNANGSSAIKVKVQDDGGTDNGGVDTSIEQPFTITIRPVNDPPSAKITRITPDSGWLEGAAITLNGEASDPDGAGDIRSLSWRVVKQGNPPIDFASGTGPSFTFTPNDGPGIYEVTLTATDLAGTNGSEVRSISVENVAPAMTLTGGDSISEGADYALTLGGVIDPGTDTISQYAINWGDGSRTELSPAVLPADRIVRHVYADGFNNYLITIDLADEDGSYVSVASKPVSVNNVAPTLTISGEGSVNEGQTYTLGLSSSDPGTDTITSWTINWGDGSEPQVVSGNPASVTHVYADGANSYTISATATDEDGTYNANTLPVSVNNLAPWDPALTPDPANVYQEGQTLKYTASATDVAADTIRYEWTVTRGGTTVTSGSGPAIAFLAADDGEYTISLTASDEDGGSTPLTYRVSVANVAPTAIDNFATTDEDTGTNIHVLANDSDPAAENDPLTVIRITQGGNGSVVLNSNGTITYTPIGDFNGRDSFTYTLDDGDGGEATATVSVTVAPVNDAPTVLNPIADVTVDEDAASGTIDLVGVFADVDIATNSDSLSYSVSSSNEALVRAAIVAGKIVLSYGANQNGTASITVTASDSGTPGLTVSDTFGVTVNPVNDAPVAAPGAINTDEDSAVSIDLRTLVEDVETADDSLVFSVSGAVNGTVSLLPDGHTAQFTPAANYNGPASFLYTVRDLGDGSSAALSGGNTVAVTVTAVNDAPTVAAVPNLNIREDVGLQTLILTGISSGPANESAQAVTITATSSNPSVLPNPIISYTNGTTGTLAYKPIKEGAATITLTVQDDGGTEHGGFDLTTYSFVVTVEDVLGYVSIGSNVTVNPVYAGTGIEPNITITFSNVTEGGMLTVSQSGPGVPPTGFRIIADDVYYDISTTADFVGNVEIWIQYDPAKVHNENNLKLFHFEDSGWVDRTISVDTENNRIYAIVTSFSPFGIYEANTAPVSVSDSYGTSEDTALRIDAPGVLVNDTDVDGDSLNAILVNQPGHGNVSLNADGSFLYTPYDGFNGIDQFTYKANDGDADAETVVVTVTVGAVNDAPVGNPLSLEVAEDGSASLLLSASDVETKPEELVYTITSLPQRGALFHDGTEVILNQTFQGSTPGLIYKPGLAIDGAGLDGFTFVVTDTGDGNSAARTSDPTAVDITIRRAVEAGAVTIDSKGVVRIGGASGNDNIVVSTVGGFLEVRIGSTVFGGSIPMSAVTDIRVWAREGDDNVDLSALANSVVVHAGSGNDNVIGGAGNDLILGGSGNDTATGGSGHDFLIGGDDSDRAIGSAGNDILTAGDIADKFDIAVLRETLKLWAESNTAVIDDGTMDDDIVTDGDYDVLTGSSGADWFIVSSGDKITDLKIDKRGDTDKVTYV